MHTDEPPHPSPLTSDSWLDLFLKHREWCDDCDEGTLCVFGRQAAYRVCGGGPVDRTGVPVVMTWQLDTDGSVRIEWGSR